MGHAPDPARSAEDRLRSALHRARLPDGITPDLDVLTSRGHVVLRRRRVLAGLAATAAVVAVGAGVAALAPFGQGEAPPATRSDPAPAPRMSTVDLEVTGSRSGDTFPVVVRAGELQDSTVSFSTRVDGRWTGDARVPLPARDGSGSVTAGDGTAGHLRLGVLPDRPSSVTGYTAAGRVVRVVDFRSKPLPGTDVHVVAITVPAEGGASPSTIAWTDPDGRERRVTVRSSVTSP